MKPVTENDALLRMQRLCARKEVCTSDARTKLTSWGLPESMTQRILCALKSDSFIDDARYAAAAVTDKYRFARWGKRKIALYLREKRLDEDLIDEAMRHIDMHEYHRILADVVKQKRNSLGGDTSTRATQKVIRHALSKGYEWRDIEPLIDHRADE